MRHRRPHQRQHEYLWPLQLREVLPRRPDRVRRRGRAGTGELGGHLGRQEPESRATASTTRCRRRCWPISGSAGSGTRSTCCRSTSARRRPPTPGIPGLNVDNDVQLRAACRLRRGGPRLQLRFGPGRQPLQLPAGSGRNAVAAGRQRHEDGRQSQLQGRSRHPAGEQSPGAERRASLRRVDASRRTAPSDRPAAALASRRSCWATSRGCAATSARTPTPASSSGGRPTTRRTPGARTRS